LDFLPLQLVILLFSFRAARATAIADALKENKKIHLLKFEEPT
jgi:hypothetical protein